MDGDIYLDFYHVTIKTSSTLWGNGKKEHYDALAERLLSLSFMNEKSLSPFNEKEINYQVVLETVDHILTAEEVIELTLSDIDFKVNRKIKQKANIVEKLADLAGKQIEVISKEGNQYNTKCEVHMPGQALSLYNEVMVLEDTCTDMLQSKLSSGWRIVAACPQPDQRRPDYILGRFNSLLEIEDTARREDDD